MGCCCSGYGNQVQPIEPNAQGLDGPLKNRSCRDVIFLVLFVAYLGGMGYTSYIGFVNGNLYSIVYGTDSWGNICSRPNNQIPGSNLSGQDMTQKSLVFYFNKDIVKDIAAGNYLDSSSTAVCVNQCPSQTISTVSELQDIANTSDIRLCRYDIMISEYHSGNANGSGSCPPLPVEKTKEIFFRCIPDSLSSILNRFGDAVSSIFNLIDQDFTEKSFIDLQNTWKEILYLTAFALALSVVMIIFLRFFAGVIVWTIVIIMVLGTLGGIGFCWYSYYLERTQNWLIGAIVATVVGIIILLVLLVMRKRIGLVVQLFKEAGKAVGRIPVLLFQPFVTVIVRGGAAAGLVYIFLFLLTSRSPSVNSSNGHVTFMEYPYLNYYIAYFVLGFLWVMEFILGCERMLISGAVVRWYFTRDKSELNWPMAKSYKTMIRYHLGSIAIGSLLIAIVQFIRIIVAFVEARLKGKENPVAVVLLKMIGCCLWCFEKFLKFLNSNAYIEIAIHGYSFCKAAKSAMSVLVRNALRVVAINSVGDFLLFLAKLGTVAIVAVVGIELFRDREVNYVWLPITIACIVSYIIASCFLSVYEMTIDAIFICFVEDCDMNDGTKQHPYYMSSGLMKYVDNSKGNSNQPSTTESAAT